MMSRMLRIVVVVMLCAGSLQAQGAPGADPITGTWTGDIGLTDTQRMPVAFDLKYQAGRITGSVSGGPATLKGGTYDPATHTFRLELDVKEESQSSVFTFEGIVAKGMVTGRVDGNGQIGTFVLTRGAAPNAPAAALGLADLRRGFDQVNGLIAEAAALVPADKYSYRPVATVRTFGQIIAHIADAYTFNCSRAAGRNAEWTAAIEKGATDKATLSEKLAAAQSVCAMAYASAPNAGPLSDNVAHTNQHYGNLVTYIRMLGLVPPSS